MPGLTTLGIQMMTKLNVAHGGATDLQPLAVGIGSYYTVNEITEYGVNIIVSRFNAKF